MSNYEGEKAMDKIKVVLVKNGFADIIEIENSGEAIRKILGGYMEVVPVKEYGDKTLLVVCDEEGKLKNKYFNFPLSYDDKVYDVVVGDALLIMSMEGEFVGNDKDAQDALKWYEDNVESGVYLITF